jgi:hypothetical protein
MIRPPSSTEASGIFGVTMVAKGNRRVINASATPSRASASPKWCHHTQLINVHNMRLQPEHRAHQGRGVTSCAKMYLKKPQARGPLPEVWHLQGQPFLQLQVRPSAQVQTKNSGRSFNMLKPCNLVTSAVGSIPVLKQSTPMSCTTA